MHGRKNWFWGRFGDIYKNGEFAAMVDETGAMNYHPYKEVFDIMDEVLKIRAEKKILEWSL